MKNTTKVRPNWFCWCWWHGRYISRSASSVEPTVVTSTTFVTAHQFCQFNQPFCQPHHFCQLRAHQFCQQYQPHYVATDEVTTFVNKARPLVTNFQRLKRQKKSQYAENLINAQISKAESSVRDFWKVWKTCSSNASVTQVAADVWFEHFSKLFYNERAPPSLPELDEREVSGLTDEISIDEVIAATRHCKYGKAAGPDA